MKCVLLLSQKNKICEQKPSVKLVYITLLYVHQTYCIKLPNFSATYILDTKNLASTPFYVPFEALRFKMFFVMLHFPVKRPLYSQVLTLKMWIKESLYHFETHF